MNKVVQTSIICDPSGEKGVANILNDTVLGQQMSETNIYPSPTSRKGIKKQKSVAELGRIIGATKAL